MPIFFFAPEAGSVDEAAGAAELAAAGADEELPLHAARLSAITALSTIARIFFIFSPLFYLFANGCRYRPPFISI